MSQDFPSSSQPMPAMPERVLRTNEDNANVQESTGISRATQDFYGVTRSETDNACPIMRERSQDDAPSRSSSTRQQVTQWQPPAQRVASFQEPRPQRATYGRAGVNDDTIYSGVEFDAPTPVNHSMVPNSRHNTVSYPDNADAYHQRPSRRNTVESAPFQSGRYSNAPRTATQRRTYLQEDRNLPDEEWYDGDARQRGPPKAYGNHYVVHEREDGGSRPPPPPEDSLRLPFAGFIKGTVRGHFIAVLGEFVGTTMFLFFAFAGTLVANVGAEANVDNTTTNATVGFSPIVNMYIAVSFGFSLMVNVWIFFRVSGGLFNPAVTLAMVMTKSINYVRGILLVGAQIAGAIFASFIVSVLFPIDFNVRTTLAESTSITRGVFIEAILTAELVFTVFMLAKEKHKATYMAPIGIGIALFVAELVGVFFTGGSLNPARSLGPCVIVGEFDEEHWIYWVGPGIGAVGAVAFYKFIKVLEYEVANPGQDMTAEEAETAKIRSKADEGDV